LRTTAPVPATPNPPNPAFLQWKEQNDWYDKDSDMREYADFVGVKYAKEYPERTVDEVCEYAGRQVRKQFPDRFRNPHRESPPSVEGGRTNPGRSTKPTWADLPEQFRAAGNKFVAQGILTREQYIDDLIRIGELKP
jgi:hypothetical protein